MDVAFSRDERTDSCVTTRGTTRGTIRISAIRDMIQWGIGAWIGIHETISRNEEPRWEVLIFAGILMGIPALIGLLHLRPESNDSTQPSARTADTQSSSP